eukprot:m.172556 g.172556  ORF g.172556 m.172556 type:complete len:218 (+) comp16720_c0_seq1:58-711(+)
MGVFWLGMVCLLSSALAAEIGTDDDNVFVDIAANKTFYINHDGNQLDLVSLLADLVEMKRQVPALQAAVQQCRYDLGNATLRLEDRIDVVDIGLQEQLSTSIQTINTTLESYATTTTVSTISQQVDNLIRTSATKTELSGEVSEVLEQLGAVSSSCSSNCSNSSSINEQRMIECFNLGLVYNASSDTCQPAFFHRLPCVPSTRTRCQLHLPRLSRHV